MRILILGGGAFVGHALTEAATSRGHEVTTFTRTTLPPGAAEGRVEAIFGDRTKVDAFDFAIGRQWDAVFDTWWGAPRVVKQSVNALKAHASYYGLVSTCSVYKGDPLALGIDESYEVVDADPSADLTNYPADKRGAELAVIEGFDSDATLIARPGLILGPHEIPGRLPWWLQRIARGGAVLAPGPRDLPLQYIDARDLADWMIASAEKGVSGIFNSISRSGHTNMSEILELCRAETKSDAEFIWVSPEFITAQGIAPWAEMPIWVDSTLRGIHSFDTSKAADAGLTCRPIAETISDTWAWLQTGGQPQMRFGLTAPGVSFEKERTVLSAWANRR